MSERGEEMHIVASVHKKHYDSRESRVRIEPMI